MGALVEAAVCRGISGFFLLFVLGPAALLFLGYLIYILVMTLHELRKK
ncbi:MAG: hypothetical protein HFG09_01920 [Oscillibacter sp.]|nr:hypothetical protein [Oscillibacter sp.]